MLRRYGMTIALAAIALSACGHKKVSRRQIPPLPPARPGYSETGVASWYGPPYHGRQAADGEIYDMETLVAAHRTLPFHTWVRVENLTNGKSVEVRIIDRGPFVGGRIIDLSKAAARAIDLIGPGVAKVRLEVIRGPEPASVVAGIFAVQVGAFSARGNAERLRSEMESRGYRPARLVERPGNPAIWRVLVGAESSEQAAFELSGRIRKDFDEKNAPLVVRVDSSGSTEP